MGKRSRPAPAPGRWDGRPEAAWTKLAWEDRSPLVRWSVRRAGGV